MRGPYWPICQDLGRNCGMHQDRQEYPGMDPGPRELGGRRMCWKHVPTRCGLLRRTMPCGMKKPTRTTKTGTKTKKTTSRSNTLYGACHSAIHTTGLNSSRPSADIILLRSGLRNRRERETISDKILDVNPGLSLRYAPAARVRALSPISSQSPSMRSAVRVEPGFYPRPCSSRRILLLQIRLHPQGIHPRQALRLHLR